MADNERWERERGERVREVLMRKRDAGEFLQRSRLWRGAAAGGVGAVEVGREGVAVEGGKPIVAAAWAWGLGWAECRRATGALIGMTPPHARANGWGDEGRGGRNRERVWEAGGREQGRVGG